MPVAYKYLQVTKSKRFSTDGWETPNSPRHCGGSLYPTRSSLRARNQSQQVECTPDPTGSHRIPPDPTFRSLDEKPTPLSFHSWRLVEDVCSHWQSLELATVVTHFWAGHVRSAARSLPTSWFQLETPHLLHWFMMPWRCWIYCNRDRERGRHIDIGACLSVYQSIYWSVNLTILTYLISSS
jgi:hypothetical protein